MLVPVPVVVVVGDGRFVDSGRTWEYMSSSIIKENIRILYQCNR